MHIGYIGLGKMGLNMVARMCEKGHQVVAYNRSPDPVVQAMVFGAQPAYTLAELVAQLSAPRTVWLMVSHQAVDEVLEALLPLLAPGDTVIDGGNSHYVDSIERVKKIEAMGIRFLDAGVSGGPGGARSGATIMVGGAIEVFAKYKSLFEDLAVPEGVAHIGEAGAGHFVKMVHNGIEYGMMQAIGEGFAVIKKSPFNVNLEHLAQLYNHGSVIESRLVGWLVSAYQRSGQDLHGISGEVSQSGEGLWTVAAGERYGVPTPVITDAVNFRSDSQNNPSYTGQVVSALRHEFGGHAVADKKIDKKADNI